MRGLDCDPPATEDHFAARGAGSARKSIGLYCVYRGPQITERSSLVVLYDLRSRSSYFNSYWDLPAVTTNRQITIGQLERSAVTVRLLAVIHPHLLSFWAR
jgi:hypothetical protein